MNKRTDYEIVKVRTTNVCSFFLLFNLQKNIFKSGCSHFVGLVFCSSRKFFFVLQIVYKVFYHDDVIDILMPPPAWVLVPWPVACAYFRQPTTRHLPTSPHRWNKEYGMKKKSHSNVKNITINSNMLLIIRIHYDL